ncbi:MAG: TetR/AcrR family transcriptional regulator [Steroidobacteraceae bacterium]
MSRKRMSRDDSREQTTQRLLAAAQKLIARKGLEAASVENIAAAAGYTRGAFYSNFGSKDDLFIELLRRDHRKSTEQLNALRADTSLPVEHIQTRARDIYAQIYRDNESFMNWTEARMLAARDARFRAKLNALMTEKRAQIAEFTRYFYERVGIAPPLPPEQIAMGFMSMAEGVKLYMMSSPAEMTSPIAESLLTLFADSIMRLARLEADSTRRD